MSYGGILAVTSKARPKMPIYDPDPILTSYCGNHAPSTDDFSCTIVNCQR